MSKSPLLHPEAMLRKPTIKAARAPLSDNELRLMPLTANIVARLEPQMSAFIPNGFMGRFLDFS